MNLISRSPHMNLTLQSATHMNTNRCHSGYMTCSSFWCAHTVCVLTTLATSLHIDLSLVKQHTLQPLFYMQNHFSRNDRYRLEQKALVSHNQSHTHVHMCCLMCARRHKFIFGPERHMGNLLCTSVCTPTHLATLNRNECASPRAKSREASASCLHCLSFTTASCAFSIPIYVHNHSDHISPNQCFILICIHNHSDHHITSNQCFMSFNLRIFGDASCFHIPLCATSFPDLHNQSNHQSTQTDSCLLPSSSFFSCLLSSNRIISQLSLIPVCSLRLFSFPASSCAFPTHPDLYT